MKPSGEISSTVSSFSPTEEQTHAELLQNNRTIIFKTTEQKNKISDKSGRIFLVEATIDHGVLVLINIYNKNTELEQLEAFSDLVSLLGKVRDIQNKNIVSGGYFNVTFGISIKNLGGINSNQQQKKNPQQN